MNDTMHPMYPKVRLDEFNTANEEKQAKLIQETITLPWAGTFLVAATLGYALLIATVVRTKEMDTFFYRLIIVDAVVEWFMSLGSFLRAAYDATGVFCGAWGKYNGLIGGEFRGLCPNIIAALFNTKWQMIMVPGHEIAGWIACFLALDRFVGFYFPVQHRKIVQGNRTILFGGGTVFIVAIYLVVSISLATWMRLVWIEGEGYASVNSWPGDYPEYQEFMWYYWQRWRVVIHLVWVILCSVLIVKKALYDMPKDANLNADAKKRNKSVARVTVVTLSLSVVSALALLYRELWFMLLRRGPWPYMAQEELFGENTIEHIRLLHYYDYMRRIAWLIQDLTNAAYAINFYLLVLMVKSFRTAFLDNVLKPVLGCLHIKVATATVAPAAATFDEKRLRALSVNATKSQK